MLNLTRDLSVREIEGRTLLGRALTYNRAYTVTDDGVAWYQEGWRPGALSRSIAACRNAFELRDRHRDRRVGLVSFEDGEHELAFRATLDDSDPGQEALELVTAGTYRTVSVGFHPERQEPRASRDMPVWRTRASVRELSVSPVGQYPDAQVLSVRSGPRASDLIEELLARGARLLVECKDVGTP